MVRALVTAGGTREPIDDIRLITNNSGGGFGLAIARALVENDITTTLLASKFLKSRLNEREPFDVVEFDTFNDLNQALDGQIDQQKPAIIFMAVAVADYSPIKQSGKIRSDQDELVIRLKKNPKLIEGLRVSCGIETFIVGFKLLAGVSREELINASMEQMKRCKLNLVIANDIRSIEKPNHPIVIVTPEGGAIDVTGDQQTVASQLVDFVLKRAKVQWKRSIKVDTALHLNNRCKDSAKNLLELAQSMGLLIDENGNISRSVFSISDMCQFWITPRKMDKSTLSGDDLIFVDSRETCNLFVGPDGSKPSIDSTVHSLIYQNLPNLEAIIHFHQGIVLADAQTDFAYPCGCVEEAQEILRLFEGDHFGNRNQLATNCEFAIKMVNHGYLIGLERGGIHRLIRQWEEIKQLYIDHLIDVGEKQAAIYLKQNDTSKLKVQPIFASAHIIGLLIQDIERNFHAFFIHPKYRNHGFGERLINILADLKLTIGAHDDCKVTKYYADRGYKIIDRIQGENGLINLLIPPQLRDDVIDCASICLFNPLQNKVLLGRRLTEPFLNYWSFPGGRLQIGENPYQAALREFNEETGVDLVRLIERGRAHFSLESSVLLGDKDGRCYKITNYQFSISGEFKLRNSAEMEPTWLSIEEALVKEPIGIGTKRVLKSLLT